jgi:kumamolisin
MRNHGGAAVGLLSLFLSFSAIAPAQNRPAGKVVIPDSSVAHPGDAGKRAHTNVEKLVPDVPFRAATPQLSGLPPYPGYLYETPASLGCIYHLAKGAVGCKPNVRAENPSGGSRSIALVDAYDDPYAAQDIKGFSDQFGLPAPNFQTIYAAGYQPPNDLGWELEESLDIEWAHAMAPKAKIYLVEAASESISDLLVAEQVASQLVAADGGGEISNSWGTGEFSQEAQYDSYFSASGIVYFASAGDEAGPIWPSVSANVVSAGGTSISRSIVTGDFQAEYGWYSTGSGPSTYISRPSFQDAIKNIVGHWRSTPDVASDSDPYTGVWVGDSGNGGWLIVGGTSAASPVWAGIVNSAGSFASSSQAELTTIYSNLGVSQDFNDITSGAPCYFYDAYVPVPGWDFCTGVGSDNGKSGK